MRGVALHAQYQRSDESNGRMRTSEDFYARVHCTVERRESSCEARIVIGWSLAIADSGHRVQVLGANTM